MLSDLAIRDVVLIERLDLRFERGLSVLTGETGAGKSILLDSLGLALGARAEARLVRQGAARAAVTAAFRVGPDHPARAILAEMEIEAEDELVLRRALSADGRSKAFVNDEPISVALLKRLGDTLVEIQGQFDQQGFLNPQGHRALLDAYGGHDALREAAADAHRAWTNAQAALDQAAREAENAAREEAYLRHAVDELDKLVPEAGEADRLAEDRIALRHAEQLGEAMTGALAALGDAGGADQRLREARKVLDRVADKAGGRLDAALAALDRAEVEMREALGELNAAAQDLDGDAGRLEAVEERLFALRDAARKYNRDPDALPALKDDMTAQLALIDRAESVMAELKAATRAARAAYERAADALSAARRDAAARLDEVVNAELAPLKLDKARFATRIEALAETAWGPDGRDRAVFEVATNPGAAPGPLNRIASGGELSRFLLALKLALAEVGSAPSLVFDEVDAGIGGATAAAVGARLKRLAERVQVLVVTHSPQVAALGRAHMKVEKIEAGGRMTTGVAALDPAARREEVARMLAGATVTQEARAAAAKLLEGAGA